MEDVKTVNGYGPYEVVSALQKCIRRGIEYDACYWALELCRTSRSMAGWCWNRLQIIACEDVGPADPMAITIVTSCRDVWERTSKNKDSHPESNILTHAVLHLCRAPKSREADAIANMLNWHRNGLDPKTRTKVRDPKLMEIPKIALDGHTIQGKKEYYRLAKEAGISSEELFTKDFREQKARVNHPVHTIGQEGVNWTEEACRYEGSDFTKAMTPAVRLDD
jgi:replication-associated recombination protein RarA